MNLDKDMEHLITVLLSNAEPCAPFGQKYCEMGKFNGTCSEYRCGKHIGLLIAEQVCPALPHTRTGDGFCVQEIDSVVQPFKFPHEQHDAMPTTRIRRCFDSHTKERTGGE